MLNQHEFNRTCQTLGLEDHELDLAALVWEKCERVMQGNTAQQAVLLGAKQLPQRPAQLSQSQLQMLYDKLRKELRFKSNILVLEQHRASTLWEKCDKEDESTLSNFDALNQQKNDIRALKAQIAKESELMRKLKKMLRTKQKGKV